MDNTSNSNPLIISSEEFGNVRFINENGVVLFCGNDVAKALGYSNTADAVSRHCRCIVKRDIPHPQNPGKQINMIFISEGDVYRLITGSHLPSAVRFEAWLFDTVVPSIRKRGIYVTDEVLRRSEEEENFLEKLVAAYKKERGNVTMLSEMNKKLLPKAVYFDTFIDPESCTNIRTTAKELQIPERRFCKFLIGGKYVYRCPAGNLMPYNRPGNDGLFRVKDFCRNGHIGSYTLITPAGKDLFRKLAETI